MKQLIFKVTSEYRPIVKHFSRYAFFFNNILNRNKRFALYLEQMDNGFLFVYPSPEDAEKFFSFHYGELSTNIHPVPKLMDQILINSLFPADSFPAAGICLNVEVLPKLHILRFAQRFHDYLQAIHHDFLVRSDDHRIQILIKSIAAVHHYTRVIFSKFSFETISNLLR